MTAMRGPLSGPKDHEVIAIAKGTCWEGACRTCDWRGPLCDDWREALSDAIDHRAHPNLAFAHDPPNPSKELAARMESECPGCGSRGSVHRYWCSA